MKDVLLEKTEEVFSPYRKALVALGEENDKVVVLGADLGNSCEIDLFKERFSERFFNVGSAEQNEIGCAVGLAFEGFIPFVHSFGVFITRRAYEQVCVQVAMHKANVKLVGVLPGLISRLGPTHQAIEDLSLMKTLPNMVVIDPADATEIEQVVRKIAEYDGPVYSRMQRREVKRFFSPQKYSFEIGRAVFLKEGEDIALVSTGLMLEHALQAHAMLEQQGIKATLLHMPTIKPLDESALRFCAKECGAFVTVENHLTTGGLGSSVADFLTQNTPCPLEKVGLHDTFAVPGTPEYLFERYHLTAPHIVEKAKKALARKNHG